VARVRAGNWGGGAAPDEAARAMGRAGGGDRPKVKPLAESDPDGARPLRLPPYRRWQWWGRRVRVSADGRQGDDLFTTPSGGWPLGA
jgi:hypothetical protein